MNEISGLIVSPIWREFMNVALEKFPAETFAAPPSTPDDIKPVLRGVWFDPIELVRQDLDENGDDRRRRDDDDTDLSLENAVAGAHDILYFVDKENPRGPQPANPQNDPQFALWEYPVSLWKASLMGEVKGN